MSDHPTDTAALRTEAQAWLRRLTSGSATALDADALHHWRRRSPAHAQAFAEAALLWRMMDDAARQALARSPAMAAVPPPRGLRRRAIMVGGPALAASAAALLVTRPPLGLWPSLSEIDADYRTQIGERRQIDVAGSLSVEMNTRTSLDLRPTHGGGTRVDLIAGEVTIAKADAHGDITVHAGGTTVHMRQGCLDVRKDGEMVNVTCVEGTLDVRGGARAESLLAGFQVSHGARGLGAPTGIDPDVSLAWRRGLLVFQDTPLAAVIDEINRYRAGRVILNSTPLRDRRVVATFRLDHIEGALDFIVEVLHVPARRLPGGIVLLG